MGWHYRDTLPGALLQQSRVDFWAVSGIGCRNAPPCVRWRAGGGEARAVSVPRRPALRHALASIQALRQASYRSTIARQVLMAKDAIGQPFRVAALVLLFCRALAGSWLLTVAALIAVLVTMPVRARIGDATWSTTLAARGARQAVARCGHLRLLFQPPNCALIAISSPRGAS
jgi:hypothetical protein